MSCILFNFLFVCLPVCVTLCISQYVSVECVRVDGVLVLDLGQIFVNKFLNNRQLLEEVE